jgi:hypothetical protein
MKNSRFLSNKTKKLTKIVNRKPKINQKSWDTTRSTSSYPPKIMKNTLKIELFASLYGI